MVVAWTDVAVAGTAGGNEYEEPPIAATLREYGWTGVPDGEWYGTAGSMDVIVDCMVPVWSEFVSRGAAGEGGESRGALADGVYGGGLAGAS